MNVKDQWGTPQKIFEKLDRIFHFTLDPCGSSKRLLNEHITTITEDGMWEPANKKYFEDINDGLSISWKEQVVYCNPPYSGYQIKDWVKKAFTERNRARAIVMLIPVRSDRKYFHDFILGHAEIQFIKGRIYFHPIEDQVKGCPSFPSMLVIYRCGQVPRSGLMDLSSFNKEE